MDELEDIIKKKNVRDVKSLYILKIIFSFLSEKLRLNMIIYNKELQNIFNVYIENYKN